MSFSSQVDKALGSMEKDAEKLVKGTLLSIFSKTIARTPVESGRLRNNWHTGIGFQNMGKRNANKGGVNSLNEASKTLKKVKMGDVVYFSNNLPYAHRIEYGGFSKAPRGMLRISVAEAGLKL